MLQQIPSTTSSSSPPNIEYFSSPASPNANDNRTSRDLVNGVKVIMNGHMQHDEEYGGEGGETDINKGCAVNYWEEDEFLKSNEAYALTNSLLEHLDEPLQSSSPTLSRSNHFDKIRGRKNNSRRRNIEPFYTKPKIVQAIVKGDIGTIRHILQSGGENVNAIDEEKRSHLHLAAAIGNVEVVKLLIAAGARVNVRDDNFVSPLHRACRNNHDLIVKCLIDAGANVDDRDRNWITPLHVCAANNSLECVKLFLDQVSNKNVTDRNGSTALHHAAYNGNCDMITYLLKQGCSTSSQDKMGRRPLHYAAATGNNDAITLLINWGAKVDAIDHRMMTPLIVSADGSHLFAFITLIENGANIRATDREGNNSLHVAAANGHDEIVEEVLMKDPEMMNIPNFYQLTPLHLASGSPKGSSAFDSLVTENACPVRIDLDCKDKFGRTPLHFAAKFGRLSRVQELIRLGAQISACDKNLMTPFHYAVRSGHIPIIDVFLAQPSFDPNYAMDCSGMTGLHHAAYLANSTVVEHLVRHRSKPSSPSIVDITGRPAHFFASLSGSLECLKLLSPFSINVLDNFDRSALHYAAASSTKSSAYDCLDYLLHDHVEGIYNVNQRDICGRTPLHFAAEFDPDDDGAKIEILIKNGAQVNAKDINDLYTINYAAAAGNVNSLRVLIDTFYWPDVKFKICPSQLACYYSKPRCLSLLLESSIFTDLVTSMKISFTKSVQCSEILENFVNAHGSADFSSISNCSVSDDSSTRTSILHSNISLERRNSETRNVEEQIKRLSDLFNQNKRRSFKLPCDGKISDFDTSSNDDLFDQTGDSEYFTAEENSPIKPMNGVEHGLNNFPGMVNGVGNGDHDRMDMLSSP